MIRRGGFAWIRWGDHWLRCSDGAADDDGGMLVLRSLPGGAS